MRKQQNTSSSSAEVCRGVVGAVAEHLNVIEKSAFTDIVDYAVWSRS